MNRFSPKRDATIKLLKAGKPKADVMRMAGISNAYYSALKRELAVATPTTLQDAISGVSANSTRNESSMTDMARGSSNAVWRVTEVTLTEPSGQTVTLSGKSVSLNLLKTLLRP